MGIFQKVRDYLSGKMKEEEIRTEVKEKESLLNEDLEKYHNNKLDLVNESFVNLKEEILNRDKKEFLGDISEGDKQYMIDRGISLDSLLENYLEYIKEWDCVDYLNERGSFKDYVDEELFGYGLTEEEYYNEYTNYGEISSPSNYVPFYKKLYQDYLKVDKEKEYTVDKPFKWGKFKIDEKDRFKIKGYINADVKLALNGVDYRVSFNELLKKSSDLQKEIKNNRDINDYNREKLEKDDPKKDSINYVEPLENADRVERSITTERLLQLQKKPISGNFDLKHLQKIHNHIFNNIYECSGKIRNEEVAKEGTNFAPTPYLLDDMRSQIFEPLKKEKFLSGLNAEDLSKRLAYYYKELNFAHPFKEGNGRTQREFIKELASKNGFSLDWGKADTKELFETTVKATIGADTKDGVDKLSKIILDCFDSKEPNKNLIKDMKKFFDIARDR